MGLSASQSRLLSLTSRLSDLEFKAQKISNSKIRLASDSADISRKYTDALDKRKLTVYDSQNNKTVDATAQNLTTYDPNSSVDTASNGGQRFIKDASGRVLVSQEVQDAYEGSGGDLEQFLNGLGYSKYSSEAEKINADSTILLSTLSAELSNGQKTGVLDKINFEDIDAAGLQAAADKAKEARDKAKVTADNDVANYEKAKTVTKNAAKEKEAAAVAVDVAMATYAATILLVGVSAGTLSPLIAVASMALAGAVAIAGVKADAYNKSVEAENKAKIKSVGEDGNGGSQKAYKDAVTKYEAAQKKADQAKIDAQTPYSNTMTDTNHSGSNNDEMMLALTNIRNTLTMINDTFIDSNNTIPGLIQTLDAYIAAGANGYSETVGGELNLIETFLSGLSAAVKAAIDKGDLPVEYSYDSAAAAYYTNVFNEIEDSNGCVTDSTNDDSNFGSSEWLQKQIDIGNLFLYEQDKSKEDYVSVSWVLDTTLNEKSDTEGIAKAQAEYNAEMDAIKAKDTNFDLELKNIDTEHNGTQKQADDIKKNIIDKNIERAYKIFNA